MQPLEKGFRGSGIEGLREENKMSTTTAPGKPLEIAAVGPSEAFYVSPCGRVTLYLGDCLDVLPTLENSGI